MNAPKDLDSVQAKGTLIRMVERPSASETQCR